MGKVTLYQGDCLEIMPTLPAGSVDAIVTDLPYGTTACSWDVIIPFAPMWEAVKRVLKPRGVFVTTASQPFTSALIMSNLEWYKDEIIWEKERPTRFLDCQTRPLKYHENIIVFSDQAGSTYNPQMRKGIKHVRGSLSSGPAKIYGNFDKRRLEESNEFYPSSLIYYKTDRREKAHSTQKPVALYEYLIRTYTNPGDVVLDMAAGSGTTGVAAIHTGRDFIGIELLAEYFQIMKKRCDEAEQQPALFDHEPKPIETQIQMEDYHG